MQAFRNPTGILRTLNIAVLAVFVTCIYAPSAQAIQKSIQDHNKQAELEATLPQNQSDTSLYAYKLKQMKGHFKEAERLYIDQKNSVIGQVTDIDAAIENGGSIFKQDDRWKTELNTGLALATEAVDLNSKVDTDFKQVADWIKEKELPELFMQRHKEAYGEYETRYSEFENKLKPLKTANSDDEKIAALEQINAFLEDQQFGRKHQAYDPEALKNRQPASAAGKPLLLTKADYFRAGIDSTPKVEVATLGDFDFSQLPTADNPEFLAESDEVVISQVIQDLAEELEHDPVQIYHWVRNNIETIPGWGSYQNSELTLGARRGNPFDVASLLIALLRASGIPSRYVMGVADIDPERYTNWIGDFENADIASDYAVANGIAIQVATAGGEIARIRTQHIWVQAAIDYFPSRGAKNRSADSWVDLDASFKQYEYLEGIDIAEVSGVDAEALVNQFIESGTVNEEAGFVQNLDSTELLAMQEQAQAVFQEHIEDGFTESIAGEVIGGRRTIIKVYPTLQSEVPYIKLTQGLTFGFLPSRLQNKIAVGFEEDRTTFPFSKVNNQKVTLQFTPATDADEIALAALMPQGEIADLSQLPNNIPSFLIRVIPELSLNGAIFRSGGSMQLGDEVDLTYVRSGPLAIHAPERYSVIAGSYLNVPLVAQSVSPSLLSQLGSKIEQTSSILENGSLSEIEAMTRENVLGDLFYAGGLGYFAQMTSLSEIVSLQGSGSIKLETGFGSYGYEPNLNTFFGVTRGIRTGGIGVNMLFSQAAESHNGDVQNRNLLRYQTGLISSALEHAMPESMFNEDRDNPIQGFSAVSGLSLASQQGQKIFSIDLDNLNEVIPQLNLDFSVEAEIRDSVRAGSLVVTHTDNVSVPGFSGAGYLILDPDTLLGEYKISGGSNGGYFEGFILGIALSFAASAALFPLLAPLLLAVAAVLAFIAVSLTVFAKESEVFGNRGVGGLRCFLAGLGSGVLAGGAVLGLLGLGGALGAATAAQLTRIVALGAVGNVATIVAAVDGLAGGNFLNLGQCVNPIPEPPVPEN